MADQPNAAASMPEIYELVGKLSTAIDVLCDGVEPQRDASRRSEQTGRRDDTQIDRARDGAQMATYEIRDLVGAALAMTPRQANDTEAALLEQCASTRKAGLSSLTLREATSSMPLRRRSAETPQNLGHFGGGRLRAALFFVADFAVEGCA